MQTIDDVPILLRREIEARMVAPFLGAFAKVLGEEKTREIAEGVVSKLAGDFGAVLARKVGVKSLSDIKEKVNPLFAKGGAVEFDYKETSADKLRWNITKCAYVDMYSKIGIPGLGRLLSCNRDSFLFKGINPGLGFTRTKTLMEGEDCCDFCLELPEKAK